MGCDIHLHSEIMVNGVWHHHNKAQIERSYLLFSKMANVRNEGEVDPITLPKGLPENVTFSTNLYLQKSPEDYHSHSWLNAEEIKELFQWFDEQTNPFFERRRMNLMFGYLFGGSFGDFLRFKSDFPEYVEDIRFIFWFDN